MKKYIPRKYEKHILYCLENSPVVGILGPRQCGKTTLVKNILTENKVYVDLENKRDSQKLENPFLFFRVNKDKLICLDEIQFLEDIFVDIKSYVDREQKNGNFLILGSASPGLLKQSSESLAGRIIYIEITNLLWSEVLNDKTFDDYFLLGGYPSSLLAKEPKFSFIWLESYISNFFQKDILNISPGIHAQQTQRLFMMLAHLHGQELNINTISKSLGISNATVKSYIDILLSSFQLFLLPAYYKNTKKRLIKSPKLYLSDTGVLHSLLNIKTMNQLLGHPVFGFSFEGIIIRNIMSEIADAEYSFYKTSNGAELDLVIELSTKTIAIEIKANSTPKVSRGFYNAIEDVKADEAWVIAQVDTAYLLKENVTVCNLSNFLEKMNLED